MNSNNREHPADFKAKEILTKLTTKFLESEKKIMKNNKNHLSKFKFLSELEIYNKYFLFD